MNIYINNNKIETKTYEKELNLHLYVMNHSNHPNGCLKGLIQGMTFRYYKLNTKIEDFKEMLKKFFQRLVNRGYQKDIVKNLIIEATKKLEIKKINSTSLQSNLLSTHIFKTTYFNKTNKYYLRQMIHKYILIQKNIDGIEYKRLIIAFKRQKNIKEIMFPSKLILPPNLNLQLLRSTPTSVYLQKPTLDYSTPT